MEALYPERQAEQAECLAYHTFQSEVWPRTVTHPAQSSEKAAGRSAHREALAFFERVL